MIFLRKLSLLQGFFSGFHANIFPEIKNDFGEAEMRDWWIEKDYIGFTAEKQIYTDDLLEAVAEKIYSEETLVNG